MTNFNGKNQNRNKYSIIILMCSFLTISITRDIKASLIPIGNNIQAANIVMGALFYMENLFREVILPVIRNGINILSHNPDNSNIMPINPILNQFGIFGDMLDTFPVNRINSQQPVLISRFLDTDDHQNLHIISFRSHIINLENNIFGTATITDIDNTPSLLIRLRNNDNFDLGIIINNNNVRDNYRLVHYNDVNNQQELDQIDLLSVLCLVLNSNINTVNRIRINNGGLSNLSERSELAWFRWNNNFALNAVIPRILHNNNERYLTSDDTFMINRTSYQNLLRDSYGDGDEEESDIMQLQRNSAFSLGIFSAIYPIIRENNKRFDLGYATLLAVSIRITLHKNEEDKK